MARQSLPAWAAQLQPVDMVGAAVLLGISRRSLVDVIAHAKHYEKRGNRKVFYPEHIGALREALACRSGRLSVETSIMPLGPSPDSAFDKALALATEHAPKNSRRSSKRLWKRHSYGEEAVRSFDEAALSYQLAGGERRFLPPIIRQFRGRALGSVKPGEIRALAQSLYPGASPATWNRQVIVPARAVINHGAGLGWCHTITVDTFPTKRPKRIAVDRAWIDAFLAEADRRHSPHVGAAMLFMFQTGTRIGETCG